MREVLSTVDDLLLLVEVVEAGGFSAASARIGMQKSQLSRRIARLEERLGVCLIKRNSRRFEVTELGRRLHEHGLSIRSETLAAMTTAHDSGSGPAGPLRVACPIALSVHLVSEVAIDFARRHPRVRLMFHTTHGVGRPSMDQFDLVIHPSVETLPNSELVAVRLVTVPYALVAAADLFAVDDWPLTPHGLAGKPAIGWNSIEPLETWRLYGPDRQTVDVRMQPQFSTDNLLSVHQAVLAGLGIARMPLAQCSEDLSTGRLRQVAPGWAPAPMSIYALYSSRRELSLAGRTFVDALATVLRHQADRLSVEATVSL